MGNGCEPDLRANVLKAIGDVQRFGNEYDAALTSYQEALHCFWVSGIAWVKRMYLLLNVVCMFEWATWRKGNKVLLK